MMITAVALAGFVAAAALRWERGPSGRVVAASSSPAVGAHPDRSVPFTAEAAKAGGPSGNTPGVDAPPAAWRARYRATDDYLAFVREALPAAWAGNGRAAWYIAQALRRCSEPSSHPDAPPWVHDLEARDAHRCLGLTREDPFKDLPHRAGGYPAAFWEERSLAANDPLAQEHAAASLLTGLATRTDLTADERAAQLKAAGVELREALVSGDPDALYRAGMLFSDARYSSDPLSGVAAALAACDLGRDCSAGNPESPVYDCQLSGACPADADFRAELQQSLGNERYTQVYARALLVKQYVRTNNWDAVLASLKIDEMTGR